MRRLETQQVVVVAVVIVGVTLLTLRVLTPRVSYAGTDFVECGEKSF